MQKILIKINIKYLLDSPKKIRNTWNDHYHLFIQVAFNK